MWQSYCPAKFISLPSCHNLWDNLHDHMFLSIATAPANYYDKGHSFSGWRSEL